MEESASNMISLKAFAAVVRLIKGRYQFTLIMLLRIWTPGVGGTRLRVCTATAPHRLLCDAVHVLMNSLHPGRGWNKGTCAHCDSAPSSALRRRTCTDEQFAPRAWVEQGYVRALRQRPVVCSARLYMYCCTFCTPGVGGTRLRVCTATAPHRLLCDAVHVLMNSLHPGRGWNKGRVRACTATAPRRLLCQAIHVLMNSLHPGRGWNKGTCVHCDSAPSSALPGYTCTDEQFAPRARVEQGYVCALRHGYFSSLRFLDAAWESFMDKREVTSANIEAKIQKTLQNMSWERKERGRARADESMDDWDRSRRGVPMKRDNDEDDENEMDNPRAFLVHADDRVVVESVRC